MKNKIQDLFSKADVLRMAAELSDEERYDYTLRQIARNRAAWLLADGDGGGISMELGGKECICIWPEACYAEQFAQGEEGVTPKRMDLDDLLDVLEEMQSEEETAFAVFPTMKDVYVAPTDTFYDDLCEQAEQEEAENPHVNPHIWSAAPQSDTKTFCIQCATGGLSGWPGPETLHCAPSRALCSGLPGRMRRSICTGRGIPRIAP